MNSSNCLPILTPLLQHFQRTVDRCSTAKTESSSADLTKLFWTSCVTLLFPRQSLSDCKRIRALRSLSPVILALFQAALDIDDSGKNQLFEQVFRNLFCVKKDEIFLPTDFNAGAFVKEISYGLTLLPDKARHSNIPTRVSTPEEFSVREQEFRCASKKQVSLPRGF